MKAEDVEFDALVVGPRDHLVLLVGTRIDMATLDDLHQEFTRRLGADRVTVLRGVEQLAVLRDTVGPCMNRSPSISMTVGTWTLCTLAAGHIGGHTDGISSWVESDGGK